MQLKIYQRLNTILLGSLLLSVIVFGFIYFNNDLATTQNEKQLLVIILFLINVSLISVYKYLEKNWDRKLILNMLEKDEVILAKINHTVVVKKIRETNMKRYLIHKMYVTIYHNDLSTENLIFYEKFNENCTEVPKGFIYITHSLSNTNNNFVIHNALLSHFPDLQPITENYEKRVKKLKYLYSYQKNGLIIEEVEEFLEKQIKV